MNLHSWVTIFHCNTCKVHQNKIQMKINLLRWKICWSALVKWWTSFSSCGWWKVHWSCAFVFFPFKTKICILIQAVLQNLGLTFINQFHPSGLTCESCRSAAVGVYEQNSFRHFRRIYFIVRRNTKGEALEMAICQYLLLIALLQVLFHTAHVYEGVLDKVCDHFHSGDSRDGGSQNSRCGGP